MCATHHHTSVERGTTRLYGPTALGPYGHTLVIHVPMALDLGIMSPTCTCHREIVYLAVLAEVTDAAATLSLCVPDQVA